MTPQPLVPETPVPFFKRRLVRITALLIAILALIMCCCIPLAAYTWSQRDILFAPWQTEVSAPTISEEPLAPPSEEPAILNPENTWDGNLAGPEMTLPDLVKGPAIVNFWDKGNYCGTLRLNEGETWNKPTFVGAYWVFQSQKSLEDRFSHHADEYKMDILHADCSILYTINDVK